MSLLVQNSGELLLLAWAVNDNSGTLEDWTLKLYKTDVTPAAGDTAASYTEADFTGYSAKTLSRGSWGSATTNGSGKAEISYGSELTWDHSGTAQTIYGYFVVGATSGTLIYSEKFASAQALENQQFAFTPKLTLSSE